MLILFIHTEALSILIGQFQFGSIGSMLSHVFPNVLRLAKVFFRSNQISLVLLYTTKAVGIEE